LVRSKIDRDGDLDLYYLVPEVTTLYQASYHNTVHMLANTMSLLLENPSEYARVREDRSLIRLMVEESLRMESPVQWLQRVVTEDTELGGVPLAKGAVLLVLFGAANRDKEVFDDPDTFLVDRPGLIAKQLAFGFGVHKCLGARLARLEGQLAFEELFERLGAIRPVPGADDGTHITSVNHRAVTSVHIAFDPPT
jgi:cytochrome P450